jgi:hypothetical protein
LRDWKKNSWLAEHKSSPEEIAALFAIVERDLASAKVAGLGDDWRLSIGYNAALQAATAALAASGFRKKRNMIGYETAGVVSEQEAREMHDLAVGLRDDVLAWLRKHSPKLAGR